LNRWNTREIFFYFTLANAITHDPNVDHLINYLYDSFIINKQEDIESCLKNAKLFHENLSKPPLLRTHYSNCDYFNRTNTWYLYIDDYKWHEYKWSLWYIKNWNNVISKNDFQRVFYSKKTHHILANNSTLLFDRLLEMVEKENLEQLNEGYISFLDYVPNDYDLTNHLTTPLLDLFYKVKPFIIVDYQNIQTRLDKAKTLSKVNILKYSNIFTKGYLEEIFAIISDDFHTELINWHEKNLVLLSKYNFDITPYKL
jgi:hypothetical protein